MLQDQSRNRTPMPAAQPPAGAVRPEPGPARAEAGIARMLSAPAATGTPSNAPTDLPVFRDGVSVPLRQAITEHAAAVAAGRAEIDDSDQAFNVHADRENAADEVLRITPCLSLADAGAKLAYLIPLIRPDLLTQRHAEHLEAMRSDIDRMAIGPDAAFLALAPVLLPMLDEFDRLWATCHVAHDHAVSALGGEPDRRIVGQSGFDDWHDRLHTSRGWFDYIEARKPADALDDRIQALLADHMEVPARTLDGLLLKQRIGRSLAQYEDVATTDLDLMVGAQIAADAGSASIDPALAGIARTRAALDHALSVEAEHRRGGAKTDLPPAWHAASDAAQDAFHRFALKETPNSQAGCQALARLTLDLREGLGLDLEEETLIVLKRIASDPLRATYRLDELAAVVRKSSPMPATSGEGTRAVLDAIQSHEKAWQAYSQASAAYDAMGDALGQTPASDETIAEADEAATEASRRSDQAWRDLLEVRPQCLHELWLLLSHIEEHYRNHNGMDDVPDIWGTLTGAVAAIRTATKAPAASQHDLSKLSVWHLFRLYEICQQQRNILLEIEGGPICEERDGSGYNALGGIVEAEGARFAFLSDDVVAELERRRPSGTEERNVILETRVSHHLRCNGTIEPVLVAEIAAAWGAK